MEYLNGVKLHRNFFEWNEGSDFKLIIGRKDGKKSKVIWEVEGDKNTKVKITVYPHILSEVNKLFYLFAYIFVIRPGLKKYLKSVLLGLEWYLKNQRPIPNNHFGSHKWFSLAD